MQLLDTSGMTLEGWHASEIDDLNLVCGILGLIRLKVLVAGASAGLLVKPFLQIRFFVSDELANFDELRPDLAIAPLFQRAAFPSGAEDELCGLFGVEKGHGSVLALTHRPINENGQAAGY